MLPEKSSGIGQETGNGNLNMGNFNNEGGCLNDTHKEWKY